MTEQNAVRVCVVDDDMDVRESAVQLLLTVDIPAEQFGAGAELLEAFDPEVPTCVITDVRMPGLSGPRLQEKLNEIAPHCVIIFVSAHGTVPLSVETMKRGAVDFLQKPYDPQALIDAVQTGMVEALERFRTHHARAEVSSRLDLLTAREREVLRLVIQGHSSQQVARSLSLSVKTVDVHRARIKAKTDAQSLQALITEVLTLEIAV